MVCRKPRADGHSPATGSQRTHHTYGQLFYTPYPSLALLVLPERAIPWTVIESQAAVVARAWSGRILMPKLWTLLIELAKRQSPVRTLKYPEDLNDLGWLNNWASQGETVNGSGNHIGKTAPRWGLYQRWLRSHFGLWDPLVWYLSSRGRRLTAARSLID